MKIKTSFLAIALMASLASCDDDSSNNDNNGVCNVGDTQVGTTVCGFNDEGFLMQSCVDSQWQDTTQCTGTDVCTNGDTQNGPTVCGDNDEGFLVQECTDGEWVDTTECNLAQCTNGDTQVGTTVCGLNDEGFFNQECINGEWQDTTVCTGTDVCVNGNTRNGTTVCGLNDEGVLIQECTDGQWVDTTECNTTQECTNGQTQVGTTVCGLNNEGFYNQECINGFWQDTTECTGTDICTNGQTQVSQDICGLNDEGFYNQECISGQWQNTTCTGTDACTNGLTQPGTTLCGLNDEGVLEQECTNGQWQDTTVCSGTDICVNGATQAGTTPCGFNNSGMLQETCENGQWVEGTTCINEVYVVINEIKAGTEGWVELYNAGTGDADISGYNIFVNGTDFEIPASTIVAAGEYYIYPSTAVNPGGSTVSLFDAPGGNMVDQAFWTSNINIYGRFPNGTGAFQQLYIHTQAAENTDLQPLTIGWCDVQWPQDFTAEVGDTTTVYGRVYIAGLTGEQGAVAVAEPQVRARLCWSDGTTDTCIDADFNSAHALDNNDEYMADVAFANPDTYLYWYEFSGDMANTWTSCANIYTATINPPSCDVSGYRLHQENSTYNYTFAPGTIIPAGKTLLLVRGATTGYDQAAFENYFGITLPAGTVYINSAGTGLAMNNDETYELFDASNVSVDGPTIAQTGTYSNLRTATDAAPGDASSWTTGPYTNSTPGTFSGTAALTGKPIISEFSDNTTYTYEFVEIYCDK